MSGFVSCDNDLETFGETSNTKLTQSNGEKDEAYAVVTEKRLLMLKLGIISVMLYDVSYKRNET